MNADNDTAENEQPLPEEILTREEALQAHSQSWALLRSIHAEIASPMAAIVQTDTILMSLESEPYENALLVS